MKKVIFQSLLLSKNRSLVKKLHLFCHMKSIAIFDTEMLGELFVNCNCLQPRIVFLDADTFTINDEICNSLISVAGFSGMTIFVVTQSSVDLKCESVIVCNIDNIEEKLDAAMPNILQQDFFIAASNNLNMQEIPSKVNEILTSFGLSPKHLGFMYIKESVILILSNRCNMKSLSKHVFPVVAAKFQTKEANIERSIRSALNHIAKKTNYKKIDLETNNGKISAKNFVSYIVNLV